MNVGTISKDQAPLMWQAYNEIGYRLSCRTKRVGHQNFHAA